MVKPAVEAGAVIDGFTVGECVHRGGMADLTDAELRSAIVYMFNYGTGARKAP